MDKFANTKEVEIKDRKFVIKKFDARTGAFMLLKVTGIIAPMLKGLDMNKVRAGDQADIMGGIDIVSVVSGLSALPEDDFDYIFNKCLQVCFESLGAGETRVMNRDHSFGVMGLETDASTALALVAHTLIFNVTGFFGAELFSSISKGISSMKSPTAKI